MKKTTLFFMLCYNLLTAQTEISFESSEGFTLGEINGQNEWIAGEEFSSLFTVSDENTTDGAYALKGGHLSTVTVAEGSLVGTLSGAYDFGTGNKEVSVDFYMESPEEGNPSEVNIFIQSSIEQLLTSRIALFDETIYVVDNDHGTLSFQPAGAFTYDTWQTLKVFHDFDNNRIYYYLNDALIYTGYKVGAATLDTFGFFFNNADSSFFIDHIVVNENPTMGKEDFAALNFKYFVKDNQLTLNSQTVIEQINIYDIQGREVLTQNPAAANATISLETLPQGVYIAHVKAGSNSESFKIVKE